MRLVVKFGKLGRLRFISHLDLQRFMQMALRRTGLPVAYSQGFNPHPIMSFASALAMGTSSQAEMLEMRLAGEVSAEEGLLRMQAALPPEMPVYAARLVEDSHPALMATLRYAEYDIRLRDGQAVLDAVAEYMAEKEVIALRKTKSGEKPADIRAMTRALDVDGDGLHAILQLTETHTLKTDLLIRTLAQRAGAPEPQARCHRLNLFAEKDDGTLIDLFEA